MGGGVGRLISGRVYKRYKKELRLTQSIGKCVFYLSLTQFLNDIITGRALIRGEAYNWNTFFLSTD